MAIEINLTNEELTRITKFGNLFDLVNYSIEFAESVIKSGKEVNVRSDYHNLAAQILEAIRQGKDKLIIASLEIEEEEETFDRMKSKSEPLSKSAQNNREKQTVSV